MTKRFKIIISILFFVLLYAFYYLVVPFAVNISDRLPALSQDIEANYGVKLSIENPKLKMGILPAAWFSADEITITKTGALPPLILKQANLKIDILPLLLGKIHIKYFSAKTLNARVIFNKNMSFSLAGLPISQKNKPKVSINGAKINITNYKIGIKDEIQNKYIRINGKIFKINEFDSSKKIDFTIKSIIEVDKNISKINANIICKLPLKNNFRDNESILNGEISNFKLQNFSPLISKITKKKILKAYGTINLRAKTSKFRNKNLVAVNIATKNLYVLFKNKSKITTNKILTTKGLFEIENNKLNIIKLSVIEKNLNLKIDGEIDKIRAKNKKFRLDFNIKKSRSEDIVNLLPPFKIKTSQVNIDKLKKYNFYSDINTKISLCGCVKNPKLYGKILVQNAYIIKPIKNSPKATLKFIFAGKKMLMRSTVPVSAKERVLVLGKFEMFGKHTTDLYIKTTKNINLSIVESVLIPLHEILGFDLGPLPMMKLQGIGNVELKVKGSKLNPHLWGHFDFRNGTLQFKKVNAQIKNATGSLIFDNQNTIFRMKKATLNSVPISISGTCTVKGKLNFIAKSVGQDANKMLQILKTSPLLKASVKQIDLLESASGKLDLSFNIYGKSKNAKKIIFNKNIFVDGIVDFHNVDFKIKNTKVKIKNSTGRLIFKNQTIEAKITSSIGKSLMLINGKIGHNHAHINVSSQSLQARDLLEYLGLINKTFKIHGLINAKFKIEANYDGQIKFNLNKLNLNISVLKPEKKNADILINNGSIILKHGKLIIKNLSVIAKHSKCYINGDISNLLKNNRKFNGRIYLNNFNFSEIKYLSKYLKLSNKNKNLLKQFSNINIHQNVLIKVKNNKLKTTIQLKNVSFTYLPEQLPIKFYSGFAELNGDKITLYRANATVESMPLLFDGTIRNIYKNPNINLYINTKPTQQFIDKIINKDSLYPLKIKGDTLLSARFTGKPNDFNIKSEFSISEDSYIQYMGGILGDKENPIRIYSDLNFKNNKIQIKNFQYDKLISSQNNKEFISPQLFANGILTFAGKNIYIHNLHVITQNPTDAKIFNIFFGKSIAKQGVFTSNILVNGLATNPILSGTANFTGVDIPLLDSTLKDINMTFKGNKLFITSMGNILSNKVALNATMANSFVPPYIVDNIEVNCDKLDLNKLSNSISNFQDEIGERQISTSKRNFDIKDLIIKNANINARRIYVNGLKAKDFNSKLTLDDTMHLNIENFKFSIADGFVKGAFQYSFFNHSAGIDLSVSNANANELASAIFDLPDQLYGDLDGHLNMYCNGKTHKSCMDTLGGYGGFDVKHGRMPKLGSLEYLLKAANLVKSGITGVTVNNIIDLVTPLKTGEFSNIRGNFKISSGIAHPIEIYSKGKDLDLFIDGAYNFSTSNADMNVFGRLSKKISTVLGPIGNASLSTLFNFIPGLNLDDPNNANFINQINKIPGFELNDKRYRIFNAKIYGDISGENYVQTFKWVE